MTKKPTRKSSTARAHNFLIFRVRGAQSVTDAILDSPSATQHARGLARETRNLLIRLREALQTREPQ